MGGKTSTTTQQVSIPKEVMDRYNAINKRAEEVAAKPFQIYSTDPSKFVAQITGQQQQGIDAVNQAAGSYAPYFEDAYGSATAGMRSAQPQDLNLEQFYNPYQQQVIDATMRQMTQANEQAQSGALGTAVSSGAFGGDRAGIAAANLANQQGLAMGSTLAGLNAQNYNQALAAAQQQQGVQLGAAQADLARLMQGGQFYAGLGQAAQQAGLQGAEAQINAGTLGQQTEQAGLTALYNQFMQQQAYPFQVAQFLANIGMGTGALSGTTTATTQPGSFFSDRRLKEDVERIGESDEGLPIYKYRYKGEPETHIGFMADEVEKVHPEAVGVHPTGYKTVDYDRAAKADGGVAGPYGFGVGSQPGVMGYVPQAYLPVGELMIADSSALQNARQSFAEQLAAAAALGENIQKLDNTWDWYQDNWGAKGREDQVGRASGATGVERAYGGRAEYLKAGLRPEQPVEKDTYLSDTLRGQEDAKRRDSLDLPGSAPQARTTGQDLADLGRVALAFMGMNRGGRAGYRNGGGPSDRMFATPARTTGDDIADAFAPLRYAITNRLPNSALALGSLGTAAAQGAAGLGLGAINQPDASQYMLDAARNSMNRYTGFETAANADMPERLSEEEVRDVLSGPTERQRLALDLTERYTPSNMTMAPERYSGDTRDPLSVVPRAGLGLDTEYGRLLRDPASFLPPEKEDRRNLRLLANEPPASLDSGREPLSFGLGRADVAGGDYSTGRPLYSGLGARLAANEPPASLASGVEPLSFGLGRADLAGGEYPTGLSMRRPMPRPAYLSTSGAEEAPVEAPAGVVPPAVTSAPAPEAGGVAGPAATPRPAPPSGERLGWDIEGPAIKTRESGGDYDALYGFSHREGRPFAGVKVTDMTVDEALAFADPDGAYGQWVARTRPDKEYGVATPLGAYQIVGRTLRHIKEGMGLTGNEKMTPELQDEMAEWLYQQEGSRPWASSEGMVQSDRGLIPSGYDPSRVIDGTARAERRGLLSGFGNEKPYEDRNALGRIFYEPEGGLNRNALLALASGVGSMLSSPSQFFLPSLGLGMQGFASTLAGLEKQEADIGLLNAQAMQNRMEADARRFITTQGGMDIVNLGNGQFVLTADYISNPTAYTTGDLETDRRIADAVRFREAQKGADTRPETDASNIFQSDVMRGIFTTEYDANKFNPAAARAMSAEIEKSASSAAMAARASIPSTLTHAMAVSKAVGGDAAVRTGVLAGIKQSVARYVDDVSRTLNQLVPGLNLPVGKAATSPENIELIMKAAIQNGLSVSTDIQALQTAMEAQPNSAMSPEANAALMAGILLDQHRNIRLDRFIKDYKANGPANGNSLQTALEAPNTFDNFYGEQMLAEKDALKAIIRYGSEVPPGWVESGMADKHPTPMDMLMDHGVDVAEKNRVILALLKDPKMGVSPFTISALTGPNGDMYIGNYFGG